MANSEQQEQETPVILLSETFVKPNYEIETAKQIYHLGPIDIMMLTFDPIQKGLLFTLNNTDIDRDKTKVVSHLLENLKHSLSIALHYFYPLGGRFTVQQYPDENSCSIFVDCKKGPGARFIHASARRFTVSDILSPKDVTIVRSFFDLGEKWVNYDAHTKALLSIQVTELLDGVFIGFSMNHSVADGTSFISFVNVLSEIYRSYANDKSDNTQISRVPILNHRPWLSFDLDNENITALKLPFRSVEEFINRGFDPSPLRERIFHFPPSSMARLKAKANQECGIETCNTISSFQALTALVWRSITRARNLPLDDQTTCLLASNVRSRFKPPVSDEYFGNFIRKVQWACKVEELLGNDLGWVALNLHKVIMAQDGNMILQKYKEYANSPIVIFRGIGPDSNNVKIGGSARFDIYGPEFGLGRALAARMGFGNKEDGKLVANPGCEGGGSVDLEICLRPHVMAALEADQEFTSFLSST